VGSHLSALGGTHQTENPRGFSEVGENKQLLIANVVSSTFILISDYISNL
jgi:hypothetical protein